MPRPLLLFKASKYIRGRINREIGLGGTEPGSRVRIRNTYLTKSIPITVIHYCALEMYGHYILSLLGIFIYAVCRYVQRSVLIWKLQTNGLLKKLS